MTREITVNADQFAIGLQELLADIEPDMEKELSEAIPRIARKGAKMLREDYTDRWNGETGKRYTSGFQAKKTHSGKVTTAEIGNKNVPGLVHLLEKGHATLTGRRARAYPHMAPTFDKIEPEVMEAVANAVGKALEG